MNPVAGGCTFYRFDKNNGKMYILLQHTYKDKKRSYYEDIGGRMEPHDLSIYHTITREINEETNGQFAVLKPELACEVKIPEGRSSSQVYFSHDKQNIKKVIEDI